MRLCFFSFDGTVYGNKDEKGNMKYDVSAEIRIAQEFYMRGHEVTLCCERSPNMEEEYKGMEVIVFPLNGEYTDDDAKVFLDKKYDLVYATAISGARLANWVAKKQKIPSAVQVLDIPYWRLDPLWVKMGQKQWAEQWDKWLKDVKESDLIIANTTPTKNHLKSLLGEEILKKTKLMYYGIDKTLADSVPEPKERTNDIVFCARLVFYKGVDLLLHALRMFKQRYGYVPKTTIIGGGDGQEYFRLLQIALMNGTPVKFVGPVCNKEKFEIIKNSKMMVYPDFNESIGGASPLEALYCKTPVICWDMLINKERFGIYPSYIEMYNIGEMVDDIHSILEDENPCIDGIDISEGKRFVKLHRTFEGNTKKLEKWFKEIIKK